MCLLALTSSRQLPADLAMDHHLDSLPYYDSDLTTFPFLRDRALDEIARELGKVPTELHPSVPPDVHLFDVRSLQLCC